MNNEIKEILELTIQFVEEELDKGTPKKDIINMYSIHLGEVFKHIKDYITNLQESEAYYYGQYKDYKSRIEKATEILKDTSVDMPSTLLIEIIDYGINVLNGRSDE